MFFLLLKSTDLFSEINARDTFLTSVFGIRDILVQIRYLWLMDPTPFFSDFKDAKKKNFSSCFILFIKLTCRHIIFSRKNLIFC